MNLQTYKFSVQTPSASTAPAPASIQSETSAKLVQDEETIITKNKFLSLSLGKSHNDTSCYSFPDQQTLINQPEHDLGKPRLVVGMAGTGKTLTICEKLNQLHRNGQLSSERKALYICFSNHMLQQVRERLIQQEVDVSFVSFKNYEVAEDIQNFFKDRQILESLLTGGGLKYVFLDQAEELGVEELTLICQGLAKPFGSDTGIMGHFWILFDVFQSRNKIHKIEMIGEKRARLLWNGKLIDEELFTSLIKGSHIWPLKTDIRSTRNILSHIKVKHLVPKLENVKSADIEGPPVKFQMVTCNEDEQLRITQIICQAVLPSLRSFLDGNILPGHTALLLDDEVMDVLSEVEGDLDEIINQLDAELQSKHDIKHKHIVPKATQDLTESILNESSIKYYVGGSSSLKGLSVRSVIFLSFSSPSRRPKEITRTFSYYNAVSRASYEAHVLDVQITEKIADSLRFPLQDVTSGLSLEVYHALASSYKLGMEARHPLVKRD